MPSASNRGQRGARRPSSAPHGGSRAADRHAGRSRSAGRTYDTGYTLPHATRHRQSSTTSMRPRWGRDPRSTAFMVVVVCLILLVLFGIGSCVSSCVAAREQQKQQEEIAKQNPADARIAQGASDTISQQLAAALANADKLQTIAQNADKYPSDSIIELALREPSAIDFVEQYPTASKDTKPYDGTVVKGTYPSLYDWDTRWGFMDYGQGPLGLTGSGPTALSMAYMGLTGKSDKTPADFAKAAVDGGYASGVSGTSAEFFDKSASSFGLECKKLPGSVDQINHNLEPGEAILVELQAGTVTDESHWALLISKNRDTSVSLYDPTSTAASSHSWDPGTIADSASSLYLVTLSEKDQTDSSQNS